MKKNERASFGTPGGNALMVIFAVLCLVVFAVLTLSSVLADRRITQASINAVTQYYEADCRGEEILAGLRAGETPQGVREENGMFCYECPMDDNRVLSVKAAVDGDRYEILQWQVKFAGQWETDDSLILFDPG